MPIREANEDYYDEPDDQTDRLQAESDEGNTAVGLLPKSILMGKDASVGDELILKITAIHDDQIQVAYPDDGEPSEDEGEEEGQMEAEAAGDEQVAEPVGDERYE